MAEYIPRESALKIVTDMMCDCKVTHKGRAIRRNINQIPTADVVEVVRCKNCKHWHEDTGWCYHHSHFMGDEGEFCHPWESANWKMFDGDDYCSDGEKKEGAEE